MCTVVGGCEAGIEGEWHPSPGQRVSSAIPRTGNRGNFAVLSLIRSDATALGQPPVSIPTTLYLPDVFGLVIDAAVSPVYRPFVMTQPSCGREGNTIACAEGGSSVLRAD